METIEAKIKRLRSLRFIQLRKEGLTLKDIADRFNVSKYAVRKAVTTVPNS